MSKCPLQLYVNEKYLESTPSVQTSNNVLKKNFKKRNNESYVQKYHGSSFLENDKCKIVGQSNGYKGGTILEEYLAEHSKSIAAYHNLQKQQEEVLNLCRQKIAKRFPSCVRAVLKDEHIIKALRIAENSDCHLLENKKSGDRLVRAVLNAIMSNVNHQTNSRNSICNNNQTSQQEDRQFRGSPSDCLNPKRKSVFSKLARLFGKSDNQKAYLTSSDNYFNNSKYVVNTSIMGVVPYSGKTDGHNSKKNRKKKQKFKSMLHKFAGDSWHASKSMESDTSSNCSDTVSNSYMKKMNKKYLTYYCTYQRDVDYLKSEIQRQKGEIQTIQKNLNRCLNILKAFEERGNRYNRNGSFKNDATTYHVLTQNKCREYPNPAEPYGRYYPHYRAEVESPCDEPPITSNGRSNSSDEQGRKCCSTKKKGKWKKCKRKKEPKGKQKDKLERNLSTELRAQSKPLVIECKCERENEPVKEQEPEQMHEVLYEKPKDKAVMTTALYHNLPPRGYSTRNRCCGPTQVKPNLPAGKSKQKCNCIECCIKFCRRFSCT